MNIEPFEPKKAKILVVEDTNMMRVMMLRHLSQAGYENVASVEDGQQALDYLEEHPVDLMLLDIQMPVLNGYETLDRVKNDPRFASTAVIMVTAVDKIESVAKCIEDGADDYMPKLFNPILLPAKIDASLELRHLRKVVASMSEA
ncbi:response regulator [Rubellicoccus peritrichatus]|uniref:Response regulator n=1 Tax=Rubellicoccus peritrichatus TaxID=3080537 RepID=A0AAQ3LDA2_9BACT|nr:response regulator [Puniceicoccus sp. CR14]WOO43656.1 response regulator [Puniceicoccus sp. CR14]